MEIEKKRETTWKFNVEDDQKNIELTSIEVSGIVRWVKFSLIDDNSTVDIKMTKEEFFNFLSLTAAFRDVVIGEESFYEEPNEKISFKEESPKIEMNEEKRYYDHSEKEKNSQEEDLDDLDPSEWDPW
jgi:hypothetical protein